MRSQLRLLIPSALLFVWLVGLFHYIIDLERERLAQDRREQVSLELTDFMVRLESELNANVFLVNGLIAHIAAVQRIDEEQIQIALQTLFELGRHVRNVGIAPGNRISHVYPLAGNESAIGLYYPEHPKQWPEVRAAIECRCTVLAGPVELFQGGQGLISRTPVFLGDSHYWGMISLVLDFDSLFAAVGLTPQVRGIRFALRKVPASKLENTQKLPFFGNPDLFTTDSLRRWMMVPGGSWEIAAKPVAGWQAKSVLLNLATWMGLIFAAVMAGLLWAYLSNRQQVIFSERRLRTILATTHDGMIVIDAKGRILEFNPAAERMFGYKAQELLGGSVNQLMPENDARQHDHYVRASSVPANRTRKMSGREIEGQRSDGTRFPLEITVGHAEMAGQRLFVGVLRDISERKDIEAKLIRLATTDSLTGTLNRRAFLESAEDSWQLAIRHHRPLSLLLIDADHFKQVNDTYGHQIGDQALQSLADSVRKCLRNRDRLGRFGGEEFIVLLPETEYAQAIHVAERLLSTVRAVRILVAGREPLAVTISIGLATREPTLARLDDLIRRADEALYRAKHEGRDRICAWKAS
ncbi:putative diguanylate cyclase YdaM [Thiorhodovibrio winogradskyi]|uniref:Diguanylate cyclase YdaM n=1 Tax=Thiorhodovibrio winogradskyi TaxID=77007 RepID=A0ABZ0S4L0_9GAMM|nr:diguanylate cyclase [Thiorhodovibrio winogradskyi]